MLTGKTPVGVGGACFFFTDSAVIIDCDSCIIAQH